MAQQPISINPTRTHRLAVAKALNESRPTTILDICCGDGWLPESLEYPAHIHGLDLYAESPSGYALFQKGDFNLGVPDNLGRYDAAICCEAMGYLQNPGLFLQSVRAHLNPGGRFILSVPNPNYAGARINHLIQGFPRSYSWFSQNDTPEPHMPWLTLGLFQLWLLLGLNGFKDITVLEVQEPKPRRSWERLVGWIIKAYARKRVRKAKNESVRRLWEQALSDQVVYGRQLVVSAVACD
ncbi:class I SAM-dependent methyltransferase [Orrella sp. NBD-18]|uniref:Class I SAM-dependent methyltransferase n=1 Tax=Sheuella amnicola TaxID=2707330 RepID=A0A6B2QU50_9BURK|nr:class I SAM-dependent methyltransferase [Sheuella amnicola]NDY81651.1 class I SAM-dependent methyltransferase [Sheuella amnicola]